MSVAKFCLRAGGLRLSKAGRRAPSAFRTAPAPRMAHAPSDAALDPATSPTAAFVVTGFGRFFNIQDNPTQHLVAWLASTGAEAGQAAGAPQTPLPAVLGTSVLNVAAKDVHCWLGPGGGLEAALAPAAAAAGVLPSSAPPPVVLLHLGVDSRAQGFKLESVAYNNADFRGADEAGWKPQKTLISLDLPLDHAAPCALSLDRVKEELTAQGFPVEVSTDPGRFICNYIYWCSLRYSSVRRQHFSLFIHVPPFEVISEQRQRAFLQAALHVLASAVAAACGTE